LRFGQRKLPRAFLPVAAAVIIALLIAIATDLVRLGPATIDLPKNAMGLTIEISRIADGDPSFDYYYVVLSISNSIDDPTIRPYEASVRLRVDPAASITRHIPTAGDHAEGETILLPDVVRTFTASAGYVSYDEPEENVGVWIVHGERLLQSTPIFDRRGDFLVDVRIRQGVSLTVTAEATLTWYYRSPVQAYPVASRTTEAGFRIASDRSST